MNKLDLPIGPARDAMSVGTRAGPGTVYRPTRLADRVDRRASGSSRSRSKIVRIADLRQRAPLQRQPRSVICAISWRSTPPVILCRSVDLRAAVDTALERYGTGELPQAALGSAAVVLGILFTP